MQSALIIFILTYIVIAVQNIPKVHISRPAGSLLGAVFMVLFGVLTLEEACAAIDFNTILFVLGMMIIAAYMEISGFFEIAENFILKQAKNGIHLLFLLIFSAGLFSSVFMNDTMCIMLTPIVLRVTHRAGLKPIPYLIALATSSNIGSAMTIIGNPQNMLIGLFSRIPFMTFLRILAPVSIIGLFFNFYIIKWIYRKEITSEPIKIIENQNSSKLQKGLLIISLFVIVFLLIFLSLGYSPPAVTMVLACFLILAGAAKPRKVLEEVDWTLLILFSGLFVVMRGIEKAGITDIILHHVKSFLMGAPLFQIASISVTSALTSNVISNVPAVILFSNIFKHIVIPKTVWLALAMSSTLAGNLTIIGSIANIIVFESAKEKVHVSFWEYFKVGLPLTFVTLIFGIAVLLFCK